MKRIASLAVLLALVACAPRSPEDARSRVLIQNKGSDSMVTIAVAWAEAYKKSVVMSASR